MSRGTRNFRSALRNGEASTFFKRGSVRKRVIEPLTDEPITVKDGNYNIVGIDPGTKLMGASVYNIIRKGTSVTVKLEKVILIDNTKTKTKHKNDPFKVLKTAVNMLTSEIIHIQNIDRIYIEDYQFRPGKTTGASRVPSLISVLRYVFEVNHNITTDIATGGKWKRVVLSDSSAKKIEIEAGIDMLYPNASSIIADKYGKKAGKQDIIDSIGVARYGMLMQLVNGDNLKEDRGGNFEVIIRR